MILFLLFLGACLGALAAGVGIASMFLVLFFYGLSQEE